MPPIAAASLIVQWIVIVIMAILLAGTLREVGLIRLRIGDHPGALLTDEGLPLGSIPPPIRFTEVDTGADCALTDFVGSRVLVAILSTSCISCRDLVPHLNEIAKTRRDISVVAVIDDSVEAVLRFRKQTNLTIPLWCSVDRLVSLQAPGTPFIYVLGEDLEVQARGVANDWVGLESLIALEGTPQGGRSFSDAPISGSVEQPAPRRRAS